MNDDQQPVPTESGNSLRQAFFKRNRLSKNKGDSLNKRRLNYGFSLSVIVMGIVSLVYLLSGMVFVSVGNELSMEFLDFSMETIRILIPPLTFMLGYLFGAKHEEHET